VAAESSVVAAESSVVAAESSVVAAETSVVAAREQCSSSKESSVVWNIDGNADQRRREEGMIIVHRPGRGC